MCATATAMERYTEIGTGRKGIGSHHSAKAGKDEWLTPPDLLKSLGRFTLDPCAPIVRPWATADRHLTIEDDGLSQVWNGRVWCNPPYGLAAAKWLDKLKSHGNGIALIFARTETRMFFDHVWSDASGILFIKGRLYFHHVDGSRARGNSGAPSCLVAYGKDNAVALKNSGIEGQFLFLDHAL